MGNVNPYTLQQAQELLRLSDARYNQLNERRRLERQLVACGSLSDFAASLGLSSGDAGELLRSRLLVEPENINLILPAISLMHATITPTDLDIQVTPTSPDPFGEQRALIVKHQLDYLWDAADGLDTVSRAAMDFLVIGETFTKTGYEYREREEDLAEQEREKAFREAESEILGVHAGTPAAGPLSDDEAAELRKRLPVTRTVVERDGVYMAYVDPCDVRVSHDASSLDDARWVAQRLVLPLDELKAREDLSNTDTLVADASLHGDEPLPRPVFTGPAVGDAESDPSQMAQIWEFYDIRTRTLLIFQDSSAVPLFDGPWPDYELPFSHETNYREKPNDFHGFGEVRNVAPLQMLHNDGLALQVENARKSAAHKYLVAADAELPEDARAALESDIPGEVVRIPTDGQDIRTAIQPFQPNALTGEVFKMIDTADQGISRVLGLNDFQTGGSGMSHMPGTAAQLVSGAQTTRSTPKVNSIERLMGHMSRVALHVYRAVMDDEVPLRVSGSRGAAVITITPDFLAGDFDVRVTGSSEGRNAATKQQEATTLINVLAPALRANGYDPEPVMKRALTLWDLDPDVYLVKLPLAQPMPPQPRVQERVDFRDMPPAAQSAALGQLGLPTGMPDPSQQAGPAADPSMTGAPGPAGDTGPTPHLDLGGMAADAQLNGQYAL